jgi:hypothetical protein
VPPGRHIVGDASPQTPDPALKVAPSFTRPLHRPRAGIPASTDEMLPSVISFRMTPRGAGLTCKASTPAKSSTPSAPDDRPPSPPPPDSPSNPARADTTGPTQTRQTGGAAALLLRPSRDPTRSHVTAAGWATIQHSQSMPGRGYLPRKPRPASAAMSCPPERRSRPGPRPFFEDPPGAVPASRPARSRRDPGVAGSSAKTERERRTQIQATPVSAQQATP